MIQTTWYNNKTIDFSLWNKNISFFIAVGHSVLKNFLKYKNGWEEKNSF